MNITILDNLAPMTLLVAVTVLLLALCMVVVTLGAMFLLLWYMKQLSYAAELGVMAGNAGAEVETYHDMAIADSMAAGRKPPLVPQDMPSLSGGRAGGPPVPQEDDRPASGI